MQLAYYNPSKLIVLDSGHRRNVLCSSVNEATSQHYQQVSLPRKYFDDTSAINHLGEVSSGHQDTIKSETCKEYYMALSSAAALMHYLKNQCHIEPRDIRISFTGPSSHMILDFSSLQSLEILQACHYFNQRNAHLKYSSVFSTINRTRTTGGKKLLKMSLVQPPKDLDTIRARQLAVKELLAVSNSDLLEKLSNLMEEIPKDHEAICLQFAITFPSQRVDKSKWISLTISKLMRLRSLLKLVPSLQQELAGSSSLLLQAIHAGLASTDVSMVLEMLNGILEEKDIKEEEIQKNVTHQIFMITCDENSVLDIARKDFYQTSQHVHELKEQYCAQFGVSNLKLLFTSKRKFYFGIARDSVQSEHEGALPAVFIPLNGSSQSTLFYTTNELNVLNSRLHTSLNDCFEIILTLIEALTERISESILHLRVLVEAISMLDLLLSFATFAKEHQEDYTCPQMERDGSLLIVEGRHLLVPERQKAETQANSTFLSTNRPFEIISGPNMAGKSTYSRQVALIIILGHIGSYVPAQFARIPIFSSILTRCTVRNDSGSIEDNLSSFYMEMQDIARVTHSLTSSSLVIVDEIGRSTSDADGEAIAWSVAEYLLSKRVFSIFISHFDVFKRMPQQYPMCLHRTFNSSSKSNPHQLQDGCFSEDNTAGDSRQYGIDLAENIGYPEEIIGRAKHLSSLVSHTKPDSSQSLGLGLGDENLRLRLEACDHLEVLCILCNQRGMSEDKLRSELGAVQEKLRELACQAPLGMDLNDDNDDEPSLARKK